MSIAFACPTCAKSFRVPDEMAGRTTACPGCKTPLMVPGGASAAFSPQYSSSPPAFQPSGGNATASGNRFKLNMSRKMLLIVGISVLSFGFLAAAVGGGLWYFVWSPSGPSSDEMRYLPSNCQMIASVKMEQLLASDAYKEIAKELPEPGKDWEKDFERNMGVPVSNVALMLFAGTISGESDFVLVMRTNKEMAASDVIANKKGPSYQEVKVGNYTIHESFKNGFCVAEKKIILFGKSDSLKKILERDKKPELSEGLQNAMKQADFSKTMAFALNFKDVRAKLDDLPGGKKLSEMMDPDEVDGMAIQVQMAKDINVQAVWLCRDAKSAEDMKVLGDGMVMLIRKIKAIPGSKELNDILAGWQSSTSKAKLNGTLTIKTEPAVKLMKAINEKSKTTFQTVGQPIGQPPVRVND